MKAKETSGFAARWHKRPYTIVLIMFCVVILGLIVVQFYLNPLYCIIQKHTLIFIKHKVTKRGVLVSTHSLPVNHAYLLYLCLCGTVCSCCHFLGVMDTVYFGFSSLQENKERYTRCDFLDPTCLIHLKHNTSCGSTVYHLDSVQLYLLHRMISFPQFRRQGAN